MTIDGFVQADAGGRPPRGRVAAEAKGGAGPAVEARIDIVEAPQASFPLSSHLTSAR